MSKTPSQNPPALETYFALLRQLADAGFETVIIGGCAVGAYARSAGITVISQDLDLLATKSTLDGILAEASALGLLIEKWPQPRSVPVAVFRWSGLEINILTATDGLSSADVEIQIAREFKLSPTDPLSVLVVDPFDLLRNKLAVRRPKDVPHIEILKTFLEEELISQFASARTARERLGPLVRYLDVIKSTTLPIGLAQRVIPLATELVDFRMLAHRIPLELSEELRLHAASETNRFAVGNILTSRLPNSPNARD